MLAIFWDKDYVALTDCLIGEQTTNEIYYASIIKQLHNAISEKRHEKINSLALLLHHNTLVRKRNIVQITIYKMHGNQR